MRGGVARSRDVGGNDKGAFLLHCGSGGCLFLFVTATAGESGGKQGCGQQRLGERRESHHALEFD